MKVLDIIYEDRQLLVIHKEAGLATESGRVGEQDAVSLAKNYLNAKGGKPYVGLVHRLDQPVEGILVLAKEKAAAAELTRQWQGGKKEAVKEYLALTVPAKDEPSCNMSMGFGSFFEEGQEDTGWTRLEDKLIWDRKENRAKIAGQNDKNAKPAILEYYIKKRTKAGLLLSIRIFTGRRHQIRLQLSHAGLPILGDRKYGCCPEGYRGGICLAEAGISFFHPKTGEQMRFSLKEEELEFRKDYLNG